MLVEVPAEARQTLAPLFEDSPGLHGLVSAVLSGMGRALANDIDRPQYAVLHLDFHLFGGRPAPDAVNDLVASLPATGWLVVPDDWHEPLQAKCAANLTPHRRVDFESVEWDRGSLRRFMHLEQGYELKRVTANDVEAYRRLASSLVYNYDSLDDYLARSFGFGVKHGERYVSGCSAFAAGGGKAEIDIQTQPEFRRRGFALAAAAAFIEFCLEHEIEPCWDAHNEPSVQLATKLGFVRPRPYTSYNVHPAPVN
jgi:RimJ/RimL family protein N-acetyltransferase